MIAQLPGAQAVSAWFNFRNYADASTPVPAGLAAVERFPVAAPEPPGDLEVNAIPELRAFGFPSVTGLTAYPRRAFKRWRKVSFGSSARSLSNLTLRSAQRWGGRPRPRGTTRCRAGRGRRLPMQCRQHDPDLGRCDGPRRPDRGGRFLRAGRRISPRMANPGESERQFSVSAWGPARSSQNPGIAAFAAAVAQSAGGPDPGCVIALQ